MGRKILFITTDQQRFDALGCNGGRYARTPVADRLAAEGLTYQRGHAQNVVCMPSRSTMVSGQYVQTHGVWMNGVPLPENAPSIAAYLKEKADYHTALLGKAHFQPALDPAGAYAEGRLARENSTGPYRGFDHVEFVMHGPVGFGHYPKFMRDEHPDDVRNFYRQVLFDANGQMQPNHAGGGDTDACQVHHNPSAREIYHTDWVADRTIAYLNALPDDADFFVWMSFPDPHHPWDPPASEIARIDWRDLDLPDGYPGSADKCREVLSRKPHHWLDWFERGGHLNIEAPLGFIPAAMQADQIREINAMTHIENELIDEACGRVIDRIAERGWQDQTDIFFTSDHGEFQGDFGLVFKGPYHVDSLMRVPFIWRPAPSTGIAPAEISEPVGHVDLAATFCEIAGIESPDWNEGRALPKASGSDRSSVVTEWDHEYQGHSVSLRTIYKDRWLCTRYLASSMYEGNEGELYDLVNDPNQFENLWDVAEHRAQRDALLEELSETLSCEPDVENRRPCVAPV